MYPRLFVFLAAMLALPAIAQQSEEYPRGAKFIIQLTGSQFASGFGEYLVPPLLRAFRKTGLKYTGGDDADYAATVETGSDVGKWVAEGDATVWLYQRFVTVGLSPADIDIEPQGKLSPSFSVKTVLITPNPDREDELRCLIRLATLELAARYTAEGHMVVNGESCARR